MVEFAATFSLMEEAESVMSVGVSFTLFMVMVKAFSKVKPPWSVVLTRTAYSDETVHPIPGQTEQLFL